MVAVYLSSVCVELSSPTIIASEYSLRISRLFGSNPVAVLATLFLLSYGKLLHTVITATFSTTLDYSNEVTVAVWLCDGNIRYLHGKQLPSFLLLVDTSGFPSSLHSPPHCVAVASSKL